MTVLQGQPPGCHPLQLHGLHSTDRLEATPLDSLEHRLQVSYSQVGFDVQTVTMTVDLLGAVSETEAVPTGWLAFPDPLRD